eukprot:1153857-Pelagomonas_calceolata.AAC.7
MNKEDWASLGGTSWAACCAGMLRLAGVLGAFVLCSRTLMKRKEKWQQFKHLKSQHCVATNVLKSSIVCKCSCTPKHNFVFAKMVAKREHQLLRSASLTVFQTLVTTPNPDQYIRGENSQIGFERLWPRPQGSYCLLACVP